MVSLILFGSFVIFLILNTPIGIALGLAAMSTIVYSGDVSVSYLAQSLTTSADSFPLMAVPFFILAGELMGKGGISRRLLKVANIFFGKYTGGLGIVTVVACMFFAAISGSGPATVAAIGGIMVPEMLRRGYDKGFTSGLIASAGSIGVIIPPSIPMVIYGVSTGVSVSTMFIAGFVPGMLIGLALIGWTYFYSKKHGYCGEKIEYTSKEKWKVVNEAKWALMVPVIILGGIYGGIFTPTEAAAVAVIYGFFVGVFIYKDLSLKDVPSVIASAALVTATVMIIIGTATSFGRILTFEQIPTRLAEAIISFSSSKFVVMSLIMLLLLFVGCFMETLAAIIILAPILLPVVTAIGVDPVHFGIAMVVNLAIGFITPPLGVNLFVTCGIANISMEKISKAIIPWLLVLMVTLLIIVIFPAVSLLLPQMLAK
ncbi:TRAP transporter large permease [Aminobacterium sp. MB27-C1]|jgi:C4-dicarboxylate transporter DctM subunit|uniref:TRAP transporter large permease n=1 Tax=Aminobacterium sp. MB27-C1 TaxID=3070661 RepID=UPI001BCC95B1|nr:TRAP transporter large permease [Aminobacterium sp. MB27-C1]MDD2207339.1 TRAP transporter large permease [Aminobacterium sp.]MDD4229668.1 TRAP transporter large permease [Aminobacterium sp.]MDD4552168.1 TRAP transporter large permease [Aminobacterium sp.]WMI71669.1 TRAP transporter large permease [Aminobacterium sp. MB27-C1]